MCMYSTLGNTFGLCGAIRTIFFLLSVWSLEQKQMLNLACGRARVHCVRVHKCMYHCLRVGVAPRANTWGEQPGRGNRWAPRLVPLGAWHEVKGEAMSAHRTPVRSRCPSGT